MPLVPDASTPGLAGHPDPDLVELFRSVRRDARATPEPSDPADMASVLLCFDGGVDTTGAPQPLLKGMIGETVELPFDARIAGARLYFGPTDLASSAAVDVRTGTFTDYPVTRAIYDTMPSISGVLKVDLNVSNWPVRRLARRDVLVFALSSFTGTANKLTLALWLRKIAVPIGSGGVVDSTANGVTDSAGTPVTFR